MPLCKLLSHRLELDAARAYIPSTGAIQPPRTTQQNDDARRAGRAGRRPHHPALLTLLHIQAAALPDRLHARQVPRRAIRRARRQAAHDGAVV